MRYYIGIDGGGSKTEGILADSLGAIIASASVGSTNPNDIGREESGKRLSELAAALSEHLPDGERVFALFAGISGATGNSEVLTEYLSRFAENVSVGTDATCLLSLVGDDGGCLISGTGSVCFLRIDGEVHRFGGWGYLLDGAGGGYDIGRDALSACLKARDTRGDETTLSARFLSLLGADVSDSIPKIYNGGKAYIASFAPIVFEEAAKGDRVSREILSSNADYLASLLKAAHRRAGKPIMVLLGGSLLTKRDELFLLISERIPKDITLLRDQRSPVYGAYLEARRNG